MTEILKSLKTSDAQEALALVRRVSAAQDREFERVRGQGPVIRPDADAAVDSLSDEKILAPSREWVQDVLTEDDSRRAARLSESMYAALDEGVG